MNAPLTLGRRGDGLRALAWTHYVEVSRQPLFGVVLALGITLVALAPALAVFSLGPAEGFVLDLGASSLMFFVAFLAATAVAASSADRLADGTTTLILTHPIGPGAALFAALLGGSLALGRAALLMGAALICAVRLGPHLHHDGVLATLLPALGLSLVWGLWASRRGRSFQAAALQAGTLLLPLSTLLGLCLDPALHLVSPATQLNPALAVAAAAVWLAFAAGVCFAGLGLCLASRLPSEAAASLTLVGFVLSSLIQAGLGVGSSQLATWLGGVTLAVAALWLIVSAARTHVGWGLGMFLTPALVALALLLVGGLGRGELALAAVVALLVAGALYASLHWERGGPPLLLCGVGLLTLWLGGVILEGGVLTLVLPDLQLFWVGDAAYRGDLVPLAYVARTTLYAALYAAGAVSLGAFLLHGRELS